MVVVKWGKIIITNLFLVPRQGFGGRNKRFQQSASTNSGAGEKETLNINAVGKIPQPSNFENKKKFYVYWLI